MRIAATFDGADIFQHFGKTELFRIYDTDSNSVTNSQTVNTNGKGHGELAPFLKDLGVEAVICGGVGAGMQNALKELGIKIYAGVKGNPDTAVRELIAGKLEYDSNPHCDHHEHHYEHGSEHHHG